MTVILPEKNTQKSKKPEPNTLILQIIEVKLSMQNFSLFSGFERE
jgi:hypothetical protein